MTALFRRPPQAERLLLYATDGKEWERALEEGTLSGLVSRTLAGHGHEAGLQWEHAHQLGLVYLKGFWPEELVLPQLAILRKGGKGSRFGIELQVDLPAGIPLREYGEDLARALAGKPLLREMEADAVVEAEEPPPLAQSPPPATRPARPSIAAQPPRPAEPAPSAEPTTPVMPTRPVEPSRSTSQSEPIDVVMPGERTAPVSGRQWQQDSGDLFGLAGEVHPEDLAGHGLEIRREDLTWLNPGDAIISPRRGPCRIKRVEDEAGQVVAKDENGRMVVLEFHELLAEFHFDDGN